MGIDFSKFKRASVVYETDRYELFSKLDYNRDVEESRVSKLTASFSQKEILNPITVNEKMQIVDGQGRYETLKRLGRPIKFVVSNGADISDCRRMNLYNTNWTLEDFVNSYAESLNDNYMWIKRTKTDTGFPYYRILRLCNIGHDKGKVNTAGSIIHSGKLKFTQEDYETVIDICNKAKEIQEALMFTLRPNDAFYTGVKVMVEWPGYIHERMLKRCSKERNSYQQMSNLEAQLKEFSRIYNARHRANSEKLFFEDYMRNKGHNVRTYEPVFAGKNKASAKTLKDSF